ncbi:MAG: Methyltransferase type 11 [Parcubacteria group bacterium Gr01-1014_46]|nr:MAG: Methyltransferase type 11 [Parcubacteria group bacterium Gr01-1014_46]
MSDLIEENLQFGESYFSKLSSDFSDKTFKEEFDLIMQLLPPKAGDKILDLGCGKGRAGLFILSKEKNCDVTFSDVSKTAGNYLSGLNFVECSMTNTPFEDNTFQKIYSLSTISHVDDIDKAVKEMYRISNGEVLITTNNKWPVYLYRILSFFKLIPKFQYDETAKKLYDVVSLRGLFERNGWKVKTIIYYGEYPSSKLRLNFLKKRLMLVAYK